MSARARLLAGAILLVTGCTHDRAPAAWHQEQGYRWRELDVPSGTAGFTSIAAATSGISFQNTVSDSTLLGNRILGQGAGVSLGDVDGDGLVDVFLARTEGCNALYRNLGGWKFEDVTTRAGVGACDRYSTGSALVDIDGDGDLDLVLLATRGPNAIFVNDGRGTFAERRDLGLDAAGKGGTTLTMADVDGDGRLDLYVANYKAYSFDDSLPPQRRAFNQVVRQVAKDRYEVVPEFRGEYSLVMRPDLGGLRLSTRGSPNEFYRNTGGRFVAEPLQSRFLDAQGKPMSPAESFSLDAHFGDLNDDGTPDLYVTNDFEDPDQLFYGVGDGTFRLAGWTALRQMSNSSMGMDAADVDGDGRPDIFVDDMLSRDPHRAQTQIPTHTALPKKPGAGALQLQQQRNVLFVNRGDGTFAEASQLAGVEATGWSWGSMFMDVDLDGRQDLLVATGHLWDIMDADVQEGLQNRLNAIDWRRMRWEFPSLPLKNVALRNRGDLTFEDASERWRFGTEADISHALASGDLDGDGDLDVVVNRLRAPALLMRNDAPAARVAVRLVGAAPNTRAVGARVRLTGGAVPLQVHEVTAGGLYMSHSDYGMSFAMGGAETATLTIDWRDGRRTTIAGVRPNREYEVTESAASPGGAAGARASSRTPLFEDASAQLGGHAHPENAFDDWDRQFLLPDALSQLGPGISWIDLDRDGREDLVVGAGKGGRLGVFRNVGGRLKRRDEGPLAPWDLTAVLGLPGADGMRLVAGVSTWEARALPDMASQPAVMGLDVRAGAIAPGASPVVGSHESSTGPIALSDVDGDGDLDLFVGSRAVPMRYPVAASSGLFRNDGGRFVFDTANAGVLHDVGLVSSATFADVDGDGDDDLLLAREWDTVLLLLNDGAGRYAVAPSSWGLGRWRSRWNGIATGDLDGDGRLDVVVTSWGRNTAMQADSARPLSLLYGPFGARGEVEMLMARADSAKAGRRTLNSYARVRVAVPEVVTRLPTFSAYADAPVEQVLGHTMASVRELSVNTMDHMVFLNRGGRFDAVPLPAAAQLAPAFGVGIADFDGDGREDLFLAQNFSPTSVGYPRYDAGRGLLLRGDGGGRFVALTGAESGIAVYGDQRGAAFADFDGDGRLDLAVSQNGDSTRLFRNRAAAPGLRVRLAGGALNPDGVGALLRVAYGAALGPVREVTAGSGFWSGNGAVQVLGLSGTPTGVQVRWPGRPWVTVPVPAGAREMTIAR